MSRACKHENTRPAWDYCSCVDCGAVITGSNWGIASNRWFPSVDAAKFYRQTGRLPEPLPDPPAAEQAVAQGLNVDDFGADPTGQRDSAPAFNSALAAAALIEQLQARNAEQADKIETWERMFMQVTRRAEAAESKLSALLAGIEAEEKEMRESAAYRGYSIDEQRAYTECADRLQAIREAAGSAAASR